MKKAPVVSFHNGELIMAMIVEEEDKSISASPFATKKDAARAVYYRGNDGPILSAIPDIMSKDRVISDASIDESIKVLTEGISAPKAEAILKGVLQSCGVIDMSNTFDYAISVEDTVELNDIYDAMITQFEAMKTSGSTASKGKLDKYFFKKHLLIQGEKGGGKTYMVSKMLEDMDDKISSIKIIGNESFEAVDLVGNYILTEDAGLMWSDGPLTQAFRIAAKGEPVVLFIDEMLRIPKRELNVLVGSLSPDSNGNFNLNIPRSMGAEVIDGEAIATKEILTVPKDKLWCIGTTNAGAGYSVDTIDEALADRFRTIIKTVSEAEIKAILIGYVKEKE